MSLQRISLSSGSVSLDNTTVDKLVSQGSGDAALLYLYLLREEGYYDPAQAGKRLNWNAARLLDAFAHLQQLGLVSGAAAPEENTLPQGDPPAYTADDISAELTAPHSAFPVLLSESERLMGRKLTTPETRTLLELFDHLDMPAEVLLPLLTDLIARTEERLGVGRRPRFSQLKKEAYAWKRQGIDTLEQVDAYLQRQEYFRKGEGQLLAAVGIRDRRAAEGEKGYLHSWLEMGFSAETVALAYERTLFRKGSMNWYYCNSILRRWHQKGIHTVEEIEAAEPTSRSRGRTGTDPVPASGGRLPGEGEQARSASDLANARHLLDLAESLKTGDGAGGGD